MAAGPVKLYQKNLEHLNPATLAGVTLKMALLTSAYTPSAGTSGHDKFSDVSGNQIAAGNGYTADGATLANAAVTAVTGGFKLSTDSAEWSASGGNIPAWRYGVIYVAGTLWGKTNPVVGYFVGDNTPADVPATLDGNPLKVHCPTGGWFDVTESA